MKAVKGIFGPRLASRLVMQSVRATSVVTCLALAFVAFDAGADTLVSSKSEDEQALPGAAWKQRPLSLEAHMGLATPVGFFGVTVEYSPIPMVGIGVGIGTNYLGYAPAVLARFRPLQGARDALVVSAAYSFGKYGFKVGSFDGSTDSGEGYWHSDLLQWAQADIGWEHRAHKGLVLRIALGAAFVTNPDGLRCVPDVYGCGDKPAQLATFDFGLGYAFLL
jgi:hypothetical protein